MVAFPNLSPSSYLKLMLPKYKKGKCSYCKKRKLVKMYHPNEEIEQAIAIKRCINCGHWMYIIKCA